MCDSTAATTTSPAHDQQLRATASALEHRGISRNSVPCHPAAEFHHQLLQGVPPAPRSPMSGNPNIRTAHCPDPNP
jgi:hypothetical protein